MAVDVAMSRIQDSSRRTLAGVISAPRVAMVTSAAPLFGAGVSRMSIWSMFYRSIGGAPNATEFLSSGMPSAATYLWINPLAKEVRRTPVPRRERELHFRETRQDLLNSLAGHWVCLEGDRIVAHGSDAARVVEEARQKGVQVPYIFRVSDEPESSVRMGL